MTERVAAIYDIHGNLPALEAVLRDIRESAVDRLVVGGDVVPGPMPRETIAVLRDLEIPVDYICGNGERVVLEQVSGIEAGILPPQVREVVRWVAQQLHPDDVRLMASWPAMHRVQVRGVGHVLFCHATPRNDTEIFTLRTPEDRLRSMFAGLDENLVICGHTHMQFDRMIGAVRVINAGSVGMPYGDPGAYWVSLGPDVQLRHTPYDLNAAADRVRNTSYPQAQEFATIDVMRPRSEREMLELFATVELK